MIDEVFMLSLERASERQSVCVDELVAQEVPFEIVHKYLGIDNIDFATTREMVEWTIQEKGWTFFETFLKNGFHNEILIAALGQSLSYLEAFEYSINTEKTLLVMHDDRKLSNTFPNIVQVLENELEDFYMVGISSDYMWIPTAEGGNVEAIVNDLKTHEMQPAPGCQLIAGMQTPTDHFIISPAGAAYFFELFSNALATERFPYFQIFTTPRIPHFNTEMKEHIFSFDKNFCQILEIGFNSLIHKDDVSDIENLAEHYENHTWNVREQHPDIVYQRPVSETRDND